MSLEKGFKFKGNFYDDKIIKTLSYDELDYLIQMVHEDIKETSEYIFPFSNDLKSRKDVPDHVKSKLKYKDACVYFHRDLKKCLNSKKISIERMFFAVCRENMDESMFMDLFNKAQKLSIGE